TLMAGVILIVMGLFKLGSMIKFIPYPVTTGFTAGIAVIIFSSQMKDLFGLSMGAPAPDFLPKWRGYIDAFRVHGVNACATTIGIGGIVIMGLLRRFAPRVPGAIIAVILAAGAIAIFHLDDNTRFGAMAVETIGTKFGGVPRELPQTHVGSLWNAIR